ncbi:MAG: enoyl-CoA hydratase/isomerase family protein [Gammaproteobacteria bacterium]|nr:enoyl-CoA hydratase/isomerase family protein [Gammaproteobacteria bacterium]
MQTLTVSTDDDGITKLTLNRPEQHNALNIELIHGIITALEDIKKDTRLLVLSGTGKSFCAGADVNWMKASKHLSAEDNRRDADDLAHMLRSLNEFPCPTLLRAHGAVMGGGAGLAACCDMAIGAHTSFYSFSEVKLGLIPAVISPYAIAAIGARQARRFFLSAEKFTAATAQAIGLIHEVCEDHALDRHVEHMINEFRNGGPMAQAECKQLIPKVANSANDTHLQEELVDTLARIRAGQEAQDGFSAMLNKTQPPWQE